MFPFCPMLGLFLLGAQAQKPDPPEAAPAYRLVFSDDFRKIDLSPDGHGAHTWYEGLWHYTKHAPLRNIRPGAHGLRLVWERGQPQPDTTISTISADGKQQHAWRYGYFEARMKWKPEAGAWPAFWLLASLNQYPTEMGELDIFEGNGQYPLSFFATLHDWQRDPDHPEKLTDVRNNAPNNRFDLPPGTDFNRFHTYGVLWEPERITWFFDGRPLHSEPCYPIFKRQDLSLVLGMQMGSDWQVGNAKGVTARNMTLSVDWVRVWQK